MGIILPCKKYASQNEKNNHVEKENITEKKKTWRKTLSQFVCLHNLQCTFSHGLPKRKEMHVLIQAEKLSEIKILISDRDNCRKLSEGNMRSKTRLWNNTAEKRQPCPSLGLGLGLGRVRGL